MTKHITITLTEAQGNELEFHLMTALDLSMYPAHKHFIQRILDKLAKAKTV